MSGKFQEEIKQCETGGCAEYFDGKCTKSANSLLMGMGVIFGIFLVTIALLVFLIYLTSASETLTVNPLDPNEVKAQTYLSNILLVGWIVVGILVVAVLALIISTVLVGKRSSSVTQTIAHMNALWYVEIISCGVAILGVIVVAIYSLLAAASIKAGENYGSNLDNYRVCVWLGSICIAAIVIMLVFIIILAVRNRNTFFSFTKEKKST